MSSNNDSRSPTTQAQQAANRAEQALRAAQVAERAANTAVARAQEIAELLKKFQHLDGKIQTNADNSQLSVTAAHKVLSDMSQMIETLGLADSNSQMLRRSDMGAAAFMPVGSTSGSVASGDDPRFTNARTPTPHALSHGPGQADEIVLKTLNGQSLFGVGDISFNVQLAGANTQIQFNDNGVLGASTGLTFNKTTGALAVTGTITASSTITALNLSGNNTGDETTATLKTKLGITTLSGSNTGDQDLSGLMVKASNLSDLTNLVTARGNLGLGSMATQNANSVAITGGALSGLTGLAVRNGGTGAFDLSLAHSGTLTAARALTFNVNDAARTVNLSGNLTVSGNTTISGTISGTNTGDQDLSGLLVKASNLSDLTNAATARTNLGLGTMATQAANSVAITGGTLSGVTLTSPTIAANAAPSTPSAGGSLFVDSADNLLKMKTAAGTVKTLQGYVAKVADYGAVADGGVADQTTAINNAITAVNAAGGGVVELGTGVYKHTGIVMKSNVILLGQGYGTTTLLFDDSVGRPAGVGLNVSNCSNIVLEGFTLKGTRPTVATAPTHHLLSGNTAKNVLVRYCEIRDSSMFGVAISKSDNVTFIYNRVYHTAADGISVQDTPNVNVSFNTIIGANDDAISLHTNDATATTLRSGIIVQGNHISESQGVSVLGAKAVSITGNVLRRIMAYGIFLNASTLFSQGDTSAFSVLIANNVIEDVFKRAETSPRNGNQSYIQITGGPKQPGTGNTLSPNLYGTGAGNLYTNNITSSTTPAAGGGWIQVLNNTLVRTKPASTSWADWGDVDDAVNGLWVGNNNGAVPYTGGIPEANLNTEAIRVVGALWNSRIAGNIIQTTGNGIQFYPAATQDLDYDNLVIENNLFTDFGGGGGAGMSLIPSGSGFNQNITIRDNIFNGDPRQAHNTRGANGTWTTTSSSVLGVYMPNVNGVKLERNVFRNVSLVYSLGTIRHMLDNVVCGQPVVTGFSTSNVGVGNMPAADAGWTHRIEDANPNNTTYGQQLQATVYSASAMPSTGTYVAGHYVRSTSSGVTTQGGWLRLTTGSAHVAGTDWLQVGSVNLDSAQTLTNKTLTSPTINGGALTGVTNFGLRNAGTGAFDLTVTHNGTLTAARTLTLNVNDAARTVSLSGNLTVSGVTTISGTFSGTSSGTNTGDQDLSGLLVKANNLSDLTNAATARTNLGLGTMATQASSAYQPLLVSGSNIRTINGQSLLGSTDLVLTSAPAGSTTQVQFNDAGVFAGSAGMTFNKTTNTLTLTGNVMADTLKGAAVVVNNNAVLYADAAHQLSLRNGANAQTLYINGSYDNGVNYQRAEFKWTGAGGATPEFIIEPTSGGTMATQYANLHLKSGYNFKITTNYGQEVLTTDQGWVFTRESIALGAGGGFDPSIRTAGSGALPAKNSNGSGTGKSLWLMGMDGASGAIATDGKHHATGAGLYAGPGNTSTTVNSNGGDAGVIHLRINAGGSPNGTGANGANGKISIRTGTDAAGTEVARINYDGSYWGPSLTTTGAATIGTTLNVQGASVFVGNNDLAFTKHVAGTSARIDDGAGNLRDLRVRNLIAAGAANTLSVAGSATGNAVTLTAAGSDSAVDVNIVTQGGGILKVNGVAVGLVSGSPGTPGGADTQVQFNDGGTLAGDAGFTYNKSTDSLTLGGTVNTAKLNLAGAVNLGNNLISAFSSTAGQGLIAIQHNAAQNGESLLAINTGNTVSGNIATVNAAAAATGYSEFRSYNTEPTTGSAKFTAMINAASTGDAFLELTKNGVQSWLVGYHQADSGKFKISGTGFGGAKDYLKIDPATGQTEIKTFLRIGTTSYIVNQYNEQLTLKSTYSNVGNANNNMILPLVIAAPTPATGQYTHGAGLTLISYYDGGSGMFAIRNERMTKTGAAALGMNQGDYQLGFYTMDGGGEYQRAVLTRDGNFLPGASNTQSIGSTAVRWNGWFNTLGVAGNQALAIQFSSLAGFGHNAGGENPYVTANGQITMSWYAGTTQMRYNNVLGWTPDAASPPHAYSIDTGLARNNAGVVEINNGTAGQYRDLLARALTLNAGTLGTPVLNISQTWNDTTNDASFASVVLLLDGSGTNGSTTITDYSSTPKTFTVSGDAKLSNTQVKYGTSSIYLDGTGDFITTATNVADFAFPGDFTIDFWAWKSANGAAGYDAVMSTYSVSNGSNGWWVELSSTRGFYFAGAGAGGGSSVLYAQQNVSPNDSTWHHYAVQRSGSTVTLFKDGLSVATGTVSYALSAANFKIGTDFYNEYFNGYLSNIRVTKGVARYSGNFTVPASAYPKAGGSAAVFTGLKYNVTDTSSYAPVTGANPNTFSMLADLQVGGVSKTSITKSGRVLAQATGYNEPAFNVMQGSTFLGGLGSNGSSVQLYHSTSSNLFSVGTAFQFNNTNIYAPAANVLEQRNGTSAQAQRLYNTYTDNSNYERAVFDWQTTANALTIGTQAAGTGSQRSVEIVAAGGYLVRLNPQNVSVDFALPGNNYLQYRNNGNGNGLALGSTSYFGWSAAAGRGDSSVDTAMGRNAQGVVEANTGTAGSYAAFRSGAIIIAKMNDPVAPTCTPSTTGGTLAAGTYGFIIVAVDGMGNQAPGAGTNATTTGTTGSVALSWTAVPGAVSYRVYFGTPSIGTSYFSTPTNSFTFTTTSGFLTGSISSSNQTGQIAFSNGMGMRTNSVGDVYFGTQSNYYTRFGISGEINLSTNGFLGWSYVASSQNSGDVGFTRTGANSNGVGEIAITNGGSTSTVSNYRDLRLRALLSYNAYTDASNYERAKLIWNANVLEIGTEAAGTGVLQATKFTGAQHSFTTAGGEQLRVTNVVGAVNYWQAQGSATGGSLWMSAQGSDTDVGMAFVAKGAGVVQLRNAGGILLNALGAASTVNYVQITSNTAGNSPVLAAWGTDTNVDLRMRSKGVGAHYFETGTFNNIQFKIGNTASAVNYLSATGAATGSGPTLTATGSDANIDVNVLTKGTGVFKVNGTAVQPLLVSGTSIKTINGQTLLGSGDLVISAGGVAGNTCTVSDTAPATPNPGDKWIDSTSGIEYTWVVDATGPGQWIDFSSGGASSAMMTPVTSALKNPISTDETTLFYTNFPVTISQINAAVRGTTSPSVSWSIRYAPDRDAVGTEVITGGITTTATTKQTLSSFNSATIGSGNWVWVKIAGTAGTVKELAVNVAF